jgi:CheY-like chemotaxis protein
MMTPTLPQHILVVDDNSDLCQLCADVLSASGYRVDTADNGEAGRQMLHGTRHDSDSYQFLITDNHMPRLSGIELIKKLRLASMALPVILALGTAPLDAGWLRLAAILQKSGPPDQSGIDLIMKLCLAPLTLPTCSASVAAFAIVGKLHLAARLPKPFSVDQLVQAVREVLPTVNQAGSPYENFIGLS